MKPNARIPVGFRSFCGFLRASLLALVFAASASAYSATFTNNFLIAETNQIYEGQDIVVDGATLTADGPHSFNSILLTNGAVLTHSPCSATVTHKLDLTVSNAVFVSADSRIDVSGKGYLPGRTTGNVRSPNYESGAGGTYGGLGGEGGLGPVYGRYQIPDDWGSGSGNSQDRGRSGGGLVSISGQTIRLDGLITADGADGGGGGAGGGIHLTVDVITGIGAIRANGGRGDFPMKAGGGGRIAVYYNENSGFAWQRVTAFGGTDSYSQGSAGTVYLRDTDEPFGTLIIDNGSIPSRGWTPLGLPGTNYFPIADVIVVRGSYTEARTEHPGLELDFQNRIVISNYATLHVDGSLRLTTNAPLMLTGGGQLNVGGSLLSDLANPLSPGGFLRVSGSYTSSVPLIVNSGTLLTEYLFAPALIITNGGTLTSLDSSASEMHKLEIEVPGTITVDEISRIDVSGKGYFEGRTTGNTTAGASADGGGSYGGLGGGPSPNRVYGDYANPDDWGSGGAWGRAIATSGGGLVRVRAKTILLDGQILADGQRRTEGPNGTSGAGSGGGIYVHVESLQGTGIIRAAGGYDDGGGGRIAVYARDFSGFDLGRITARGGSQFYYDDFAGAGTVYVRDTDAIRAELIIDNGPNSFGGWTALGIAGTNSFVIPDTVVIRGPGTRVGNEHPGLVLDFQNTLIITNSAILELTADFLISTNAQLIFSDGGRLTVAGNVISHLGTPFQGNGLFEVSGDYRSLVPLTVSASTLAVDRLLAPHVLVTNAGVLACPASTPTRMHMLELEVPGIVSVSTNSRIDVSGKGYVAGRTSGNTTVGASTGRSGGSYGGLGGAYGGGFEGDPIPNPIYGDYADPDDWGSAGPVWISPPNSGGGLIRMHASRLCLEGQVLADGTSEYHVGGAGGGILLALNSLSGNGLIKANGGRCTEGGAGGGGRIAVYAALLTEFNTNNISATGGISGSGANAVRNGGTGTVHIVRGGYHTHARWHIPAGRNGGYMSNSLDSITIGFNKPLRTNSFSPSMFEIRGPLGLVTSTALFLTADRTYRITFPNQTENGAYHFTLSPELLDAEGFMLDQNANGVPGEPLDDTYTFTLAIDTVAPRITHHAPSGDIAGTLSSLDVWFSEGMDRATLVPANILLTNSLGQNIGISGIQEVGLNRFRFSFPAQTTPATYTLSASSNITDLAGNPLSAINSRPCIVNLIPVDLELTAVTLSTNMLTAGDPITIAWTGRNNSGAPLLGDWSDGVYLSQDNRWDISDILLATVPHMGGLSSNEIYSAQASVSVPGVLPGSYYLLVRADIANTERELSETNNIVAFGPVPLTVRSLAGDGTPVSGTLTASNRAHYFAIYVPGGESLRLRLSGSGSGSVNHLFVSQSVIPSALNSDHASATASRDQGITLTGLSGGATYYVLVHGNQISGESPYSLVAETASFFVTSISPSRLSGVSSVSPCEGFYLGKPVARVIPGVVTVTGVGFDKNTTVDFISGDTLLVPSSIHLISSTTLALDLNLRQWPAGTYDVRVSKGSAGLTRPAAFTVFAGGRPQLDARLVVPNAISPGFPVRQTLWIDYANTGDVPLVAPLFKVSADLSAYFTHVAATLGIRGLVNVPLQTVAQVMATGSGATPGILQPGDRGRIPIYYLGLQRDNGAPNIVFSLSRATADDVSWTRFIPRQNVSAVARAANLATERLTKAADTGDSHVDEFETASDFVFCGTGDYQPVDRSIPWQTLKSELRPETIPSDAWDVVWANLAAQVGSDWGHYVERLAANMNHLAAVGQATNDPATLFNFEILKASAALNPIRNLAGAVDASAPSSGFPLVFRRVYGQPIASRFRIGPFGRGWSHNWDISVQPLTNGNVVVHGPGGVDRFFTLTPGVGYQPAPGDFGELLPVADGFRLTETDKTVWKFRTDFRLDYVEDANANRITCGYTGGRLTSLNHSSGKQFILEYDGSGHLWHLTDPLGPGSDDDRVTTYEYTGEHLTTVTAPGDRITRYAYDTTVGSPRQHALRSVEYSDLRHDYFGYDDRGRLEATYSDGNAQRVTYTYDSAGKVTISDATDRQTILSYGIGGQLAQVRDGEGRLVDFSYTNSQLSHLLGPGGERYRYAYDAHGNLSGIEDPLRRPNSFLYEPAFNRLARVTDARGNGLQYGYDTHGDLTSIAYADNTRETFGYDERGNVLTVTNRRGGVINYRYNAAGQLTNKYYLTATGRVDYFYTYDDAGNLRSAIGPEGTTSMDYYPNTDRLRRIEYPGGTQWFEFGYDNAGRRTSRSDQDGHRTHYVYDAVGRLALMTNGLGQLIVDYDYDTAGRLQRKTLGNQVFTTYDYNAAGQITNLFNHKPDGSLLSRYEYTYDASGRRTSMKVTRGYVFPLPEGEGQGEGEAQTYGYDALGQLTRVEYADSRVVEYVYDAAGNRTEVKDNGASTIYTPNALNQYTTVGSATYLYDPDGNLTNKTENGVTTTYTYDIENRLIGVATPTDTWSYGYDAFGNRIASAHNGQPTRYVIDPVGLGNVAAELDGSGALVARYEHGFGLLNRSDAAGNPAHYTFSAIGHTSELSDAAGSVANAYAYDPCGVSLANSEAFPNSFEFVGEFGVINDDHGLKFMRARAYDESAGRFARQDPIGIAGGINLYNYVENDPVSGIDPSGLVEDGWTHVQSYWRNTFNDPSNPGRRILAEAVERADIRLRAHLQGVAIGGAIATSPYWGPPAAALALRHPKITAEIVLALLERRLNVSSPPIIGVSDWPGVIINADHLFENIRFIAATEGPIQTWLTLIARSRDPNDKLAPAGYGASAFVRADSALAYQIRFENQPSATAPAQKIVITDTLDPDLDLSTFELAEITFANQIIPVPMGLNHYEVRPFTTGTNNILAEVQAALDVPTRTLTLTLRAIDPATGWFPEDPLTGLLYPNDATGRGEGSISYIVKPRSGLPSGTRIENRARIYFDFNEPIDTPLVFNTLDSGPPSSAVTALAATNISPFLVQWSGADDAGGSGIASYDVYVSDDRTNYVLWLENTTASSAFFNGGAGRTYYFYSIARDNVRHVEAAPAVPDTHTTVSGNTPPLLAAPPSRIAFVSRTLFVTNAAFDLDLPAQSLTFSLGANAPLGATINPTNGLFRWRPTASYASTTNLISVIVSDSGAPNLSATQTLVVVVTEYLQPALGTYVLRAGESGFVSARIVSSVGLSSLCFTIEYPSNRLDQLALGDLTAEIANASVTSISATQSVICFSNYPGQFLIGTQEVANLVFLAVSNQTSAFLPLRISDVHAFGVNGTPINNVFVQGGRIVVVADQPLLEAILTTNGEEQLIVYGRLGATCAIDKTLNLQTPMWSEVAQITLTNLFQTIPNPAPNHPVEYLRARKLP